MFEFLKVVTSTNANLYREDDSLDVEACADVGIPEAILDDFDGVALVSSLPEERPLYKGFMLLDGQAFGFYRYPNNTYLLLV